MNKHTLNYIAIIMTALTLHIITVAQHNKEVEEAYLAGAVSVVIPEANPHTLTKKEKETIALQWWTNSTDMIEVRKRLCTGKFK